MAQPTSTPSQQSGSPFTFKSVTVEGATYTVGITSKLPSGCIMGTLAMGFMVGTCGDLAADLDLARRAVVTLQAKAAGTVSPVP